MMKNPWREYKKDLKYIEKKYKNSNEKDDCSLEEYEEFANEITKNTDSRCGIINFAKWIESENTEDYEISDSFEFEPKIRRNPRRLSRDNRINENNRRISGDNRGINYCYGISENNRRISDDDPIIINPTKFAEWYLDTETTEHALEFTAQDLESDVIYLDTPHLAAEDQPPACNKKSYRKMPPEDMSPPASPHLTVDNQPPAWSHTKSYMKISPHKIPPAWRYKKSSWKTSPHSVLPPASPRTAAKIQPPAWNIRKDSREISPRVVLPPTEPHAAEHRPPALNIQKYSRKISTSDILPPVSPNVAENQPPAWNIRKYSRKISPCVAPPTAFMSASPRRAPHDIPPGKYCRIKKTSSRVSPRFKPPVTPTASNPANQYYKDFDEDSYDDIVNTNLLNEIARLERHLCEIIQTNRALIESGQMKEGIPMPELIYCERDKENCEESESEIAPWKRKYSNKVSLKIPLSSEDKILSNNIKFVPATPVKDVGFLSRDQFGVYFSPRGKPNEKILVHDSNINYSPVKVAPPTTYKSIQNQNIPKRLFF